MPPFALTYDYALTISGEPGYYKQYDGREIVSFLNSQPDGTSNKAFWTDQTGSVLMLKPQQLEDNWLNSAGQLPYLIRLADFQANPTNVSTLLITEAAFLQNADNPFIHHGPISPAAPVTWVDSPEQVPGIQDIENQSSETGLVTGFPGAPGGRPFPTTILSDVKTICWTKAKLSWNIPLFLRWHVPPAASGHKTLYEFCIGQFLIRCGPSLVEVFQDISAHGDRSAWQKQFSQPLFSGGPIQTSGAFATISNAFITEFQRETRGLLWFPYRRNAVYLESSYGKGAAFLARPFPLFNGETDPALQDWNIVEPRNLVVRALIPGPGAFQVQKVKFPDAVATFNLPTFTTNYSPAGGPLPGWLVPDEDAYHGASVAFGTPTQTAVYTVPSNNVNADCLPVTSTNDASDQSRTYYAQGTMTAGTEPSGLKVYTPMLYNIDVRIQATGGTWPVTSTTITDVSIASPSARIKSASIMLERSQPGRFDALVDDLGVSLAAFYGRSYYPIQFADQNGAPGTPAAWTSLFIGVVDPSEIRETRLDTAAPREFRVAATDLTKWLHDSVMRDNRDWSGFGFISVIQSVLQQAGISIANWDGPAAGSAYDQPLGGLNRNSAPLANGTDIPTAADPLKPAWRPLRNPPDSYLSYVKRIADVFAGWEFGFHADSSPYLLPFDYYQTSEVVFFKNRPGHTSGPTYYLGTPSRRPIEPDANIVQAVAGRRSGGFQQSSPFIDFGSLYSQSAPNFMGKPKVYVFSIPGWLPCTEINICARNVFRRARRRRLTIKVKTDYCPALKVNHCFQLEGVTGTWRLTGLKADYERPSYNTAMLDAELVEAGHL